MTARGSSSPPCPMCASAATIPVVYGLPGEELHQRSIRGEVVLGGCIVGSNFPDPDPSHSCTSCGTWFDAATRRVVQR
jgi:hypothetical protein